MNNEPWYSAKCIFHHSDLRNKRGRVYEERVVLIRADNFNEAIARAEKLAKKYAKGLDGCKYLGFVDVFHIFGESIEDGTEIYSLMRDSKLSKNKYLDRFFDTGKEHTQKIQ